MAGPALNLAQLAEQITTLRLAQLGTRAVVEEVERLGVTRAQLAELVGEYVDEALEGVLAEKNQWSLAYQFRDAFGNIGARVAEKLLADWLESVERKP
jgi:hypothetical protein